MKLLASDYDNTISFNGVIKETDKAAIRDFQNQGNLFGVCTGRSLRGVVEFTKGIDFDFYILLSGAYILNKKKKVILENRIPLKLVQEIHQFVGNVDASANYQDTNYQVYQKKRKTSFGKQIDSFLQLDDITDYVNSFSLHFKEGEDDKAKKTALRIEKTFGNQIEVFLNTRHIDLAAKGSSKCKALQIVQEYYNLEKNQLYAIGDSYNDLPMLNAIDNSYTFASSPENIKNQVKTIVTSVSECIEDIELRDKNGI